MVMEVCCGQCNGRLLVETPGVVVACPHCGVHLSIPLPDDDPEAPVPNDLGVDQLMVSTVSEPVLHSEEPVSDDVAANPVGVKPPGDAIETMISTGSPPEPLPLPIVPIIVAAPTSSIFGGPDEDHSDQSPSSDLGSSDEENLSPSNPVLQTDAPQALDAPNTPAHQHMSPVQQLLTPEDRARIELEWATRQTPKPTLISEPASAEQSKVEEIEQTILQQIDFGNSPNFLQAVDVGSPPVTPPSEPTQSLDGPSQPINPFASLDSPTIAWTAQPSTPASHTFSFDQPNSAAGAPAFDLETFAAPASAVINSSNDESQSRSAMPASSTAHQFVESVDTKQSKLSMALLIIGSYASLMTIYVVYLTLFGRKHQLESLPDLKTVQQSGGRAAVPRPENDLPPGHDLKLGQSQRFGNIRVTPLQVTRGPITFKHFGGDIGGSRAPSEPVLKLWLKFENLSDRQSIVPLDTTLMFFQRYTDNHVASYNVIFREADRKQRQAQFYYMFDGMAADSEWIMVGQHTNETLAPGQSFETFVPSEANTEGLTGNLVWRVHFRKGHGPETGNGVTTLIDVRFSSDDVEPDPA